MSEELKDHARELLEGIETPRWTALTTGVASGAHWFVVDPYGLAVAHISANDGEDEHLRQPRASLIAAAPELIRDLLAALETAEAERDQLRESWRALGGDA